MPLSAIGNVQPLPPPVSGRCFVEGVGGSPLSASVFAEERDIKK